MWSGRAFLIDGGRFSPHYNARRMIPALKAPQPAAPEDGRTPTKPWKK